MKLKLNELLGLISLGLGTILSLTWFFDLFQEFTYFFERLTDGYVDFSYVLYFIGVVFGILITPLLITSAILIFIKKSKFSLFASVLATVFWLLSSVFQLFGFMVGGFGSIFGGFKVFFLHFNSGFSFFSGIPLFVFALVASVLLFLGEFPNKISALAPLAATLSKPLQGGAHHQQQYMPPQQQHYAPPVQHYAPPQQAAPVAPGMKKCPECAELVQPEAIKCRFCNYRFA